MKLYLDANNLALKMAERGWNQRDLAQQARISTNTVSAVFCGKSCSVKTLKALADALEVGAIELSKKS
ncbi:MAG: helix-turn-helix transcriptional regulator [Firmicutes bacterium]|nr:helix-turn-helix transcriptional regulator [Bacillota bacterium]